MNNKQVIEKVTNHLIELMEQGKLNWNKPWTCGTMPQNYTTKKAYRGWNLIYTMFSEFTSPYWLTFKQVQALKGTIKKGSKATPIIFWKPSEYERVKADGTKEKKKFLLLKYYNVFNADQIDGIEFKKIQMNDIGTIESIEQTISNMECPVTIKHTQSDRAFYSPSSDYINMPLKGLFKSTEEYYSTLIHETIHSTGNRKRLNRFEKTRTDFDSYKHDYSFEELVAEMGTAIMMAMFNTATPQTEKNSAAYLQSWLDTFKQDKEMLFKAVSHAQKAIDYILKPKTTDTTTNDDETESDDIE